MGEDGVLGEVRLLLELLVDAHVGKVLDVGGHLGEGLRLVLLLDLRVDAALPGRLVELPLRHLGGRLK